MPAIKEKKTFNFSQIKVFNDEHLFKFAAMGNTDVLETLDTSLEGLEHEQYDERLEEYGENTALEDKPV